jgi:hypothetical protein
MTDTIGIPGDRIRSFIERVKHIDEEINAPTTLVAEKASDIAKLSGSMLPEHDPEIEAVCADGLGRILLLEETPCRTRRPQGLNADRVGGRQ